MRIIAVIIILNFVVAQPENNEMSVLPTDTLQINRDLSQIEWIGRKVTGEHSGTVELSAGWITMNDSTIMGGKFIFEMTSIKNMDIESPEWKLKLEDHLKSSDFFNVDSFPQAILEIKKNHFMPEENDIDAKYLLNADLTIRGITHEISFPYQLEQSDSTLFAIGKVDIDRTQYNIKYKSGAYFFDLGDKMIYDDFTIQFTLHTLPF